MFLLKLKINYDINESPTVIDIACSKSKQMLVYMEKVVRKSIIDFNNERSELIERLSATRKTNPLSLTEELKLEEELKKKYFDINSIDNLSITLNEFKRSSFVIEEIKEIEVDLEIL